MLGFITPTHLENKQILDKLLLSGGFFFCMPAETAFPSLSKLPLHLLILQLGTGEP